jgi:hypothetical protein
MRTTDVSLRGDNRIESFSLSITHTGDADAPYDLQWEIVSFTSIADDVKVQGHALAGRKVTYGQVLALVAQVLRGRDH